ncbi:flagellar biosynthetic protein FliQ [Clostridium perfringens]
MTIALAMGVIRESVMIILLISGILIVPSFIIGLLISIFQATTQIQEQTMTFIPKLMVTLLMIVFCGPFIINKVSEHFLNILTLIVGNI